MVTIRSSFVRTLIASRMKPSYPNCRHGGRCDAGAGCSETYGSNEPGLCDMGVRLFVLQV